MEKIRLHTSYTRKLNQSGNHKQAKRVRILFKGTSRQRQQCEQQNRTYYQQKKRNEIFVES